MTMDDNSAVRSEARSSASRSTPSALRVARWLFCIQSAAWILLGPLLVVGGLIVLSGVLAFRAL